MASAPPAIQRSPCPVTSWRRSNRAAVKIEQAAAQLRERAIRDGYSGLVFPSVAFSLGLVLDELARHVRDLEDELRACRCPKLRAQPVACSFVRGRWPGMLRWWRCS